MLSLFPHYHNGIVWPYPWNHLFSITVHTWWTAYGYWSSPPNFWSSFHTTCPDFIDMLSYSRVSSLDWQFTSCSPATPWMCRRRPSLKQSQHCSFSSSCLRYFPVQDFFTPSNVLTNFSLICSGLPDWASNALFPESGREGFLQKKRCH